MLSSVSKDNRKLQVWGITNMILTLKYRDQIKIPRKHTLSGPGTLWCCYQPTGCSYTFLETKIQPTSVDQKRRVLIRSLSVQKGESGGGKRKEIAESWHSTRGKECIMKLKKLRNQNNSLSTRMLLNRGADRLPISETTGMYNCQAYGI